MQLKLILLFLSISISALAQTGTASNVLGSNYLLGQSSAQLVYGADCFNVSCTSNNCVLQGNQFTVPTSRAEFDNLNANSALKSSLGISVSACVSLPSGSWNVGSWGTCNSSCTQTRTVTCSTGNSADCPLPVPSSSQGCTGGSCPTGTGVWILGAYSACNSSCEQTRSYTCSVLGECTTAQPPDETQACTGGACPPSCTYPTNVGSITDCTDACPGGPTKMCQEGNSSGTLILCPGSGGQCNCQSFTGGCLVTGGYSWDVFTTPCIENPTGTCFVNDRVRCLRDSDNAISNLSNCSGSPPVTSGSAAYVPSGNWCNPGPTETCYRKNVACPGVGACFSPSF